MGVFTLEKCSTAQKTSYFGNTDLGYCKLGVMFGLGFDTSSEVALLGIASIQGAKGTSIWLILIFPVLFTSMSPC